MKIRLLWKFLGLNLLVIGFVILVVWGAIDYLAAGYFITLMEKYHISPNESHQMFIDSVHRYLLWGSFLAALLAAVVSTLITRRILGPLTRMQQITQRIASGDFSAEIPVVTRDEVGDLSQAFNRMTESLNHMEQLRKTMIVDAAHEFKTPLTNIRGYLEALADGMVPASKETFSLLEKESERLVRLVSDILKLARAGGARISLDILEIALMDAVTNVYEMFHLRFSEKNIRADLSGIDDGCRVLADPHKLSQMLHNLFENALQYTPRDGILKVSADPLPPEIRISFVNTCEHLREEDLPLLFERFFRGERSRSREYGGAGIGLAVVKDLVEAHRGRVGADMAAGEIRVWFTLPGKHG